MYVHNYVWLFMLHAYSQNALLSTLDKAVSLLTFGRNAATS